MIKSKVKVWRTYPEFEWIQGNNYGEVRTIDRWGPTSRGNGKRLVKGQILKQYHNNSGYLRVNFSVNGKNINRYVHRIIAECFLPNPDNLPEINHIDCNPLNNCINNLEWCTHEYNCQYREKFGIPTAESHGHPLYAINLNTLEVYCFSSQREASRELNISQGHISSVIKGKRKQTGGYWFTNADNNAVDVTKNKLHNIIDNRIEDLKVGDSSDEVVNFVSKCLM